MTRRKLLGDADELMEFYGALALVEGRRREQEAKKAWRMLAYLKWRRVRIAIEDQERRAKIVNEKLPTQEEPEAWIAYVLREVNKLSRYRRSPGVSLH